jgi:hypothetical protein
MAGTAPLSALVQVTLDASGNGTASVGPTGSGEVWSQITVAVHCATNTSEATCRIYAGSDASPRYFSDGTTWGSTGDSSTNLPPTLPVGQKISAVWSGGDSGTTAYMSLSGIRTVA